MKRPFSFYIVIILLLMSSIACTEDAVLPAFDDIYLNVSAKVENDKILLSADIESAGYDVSTRGFYLKRTLKNRYDGQNGEIIISRHLVPEDQSTFALELDDLLGNRANYEVYAYATVGGNRIYRSEPCHFIVDKTVLPTIESVTIQTNADNVTGTIILKGKNFALDNYDNLVIEEQNLPGDVSFSHDFYYKPTTTEISFMYSCYNIGEFTLALVRDGQKIILDKKLEVKGPKLIGIQPEKPQAGEWFELMMEDAANHSYFSFEGSEHKQENGKYYAMFPKIPERLTAHLFFKVPGKMQRAYLPATEIQFTSHWKECPFIENEFEYGFEVEFDNIVGNTAYRLYHETLYSYTFADNKMETFPINLFEKGVNQVFIMPICCSIMDNYLYGFIYAHSFAGSEHYFSTTVIRIDLSTKEWEVYDVYPHPSHSTGLSSVTCKDFIVIAYNSDYSIVTAYYPKTKEVKHINMDGRWVSLIGEYNNYLYFLERTDKNILKRVNLENTNQIETLGEYRAAEVKMHDGYIYFCNQNYISRIKIEEAGKAAETLGAPYNTPLYNMYPTDNGIYATDYYKSKLYWREIKPEN